MIGILIYVIGGFFSNLYLAKKYAKNTNLRHKLDEIAAKDTATHKYDVESIERLKDYVVKVLAFISALIWPISLSYIAYRNYRRKS